MITTKTILFEARKRSGLTQIGLSKSYGISQSDVSKYERGLQSPRFDDVVGLVECMGFNFIRFYTLLVEEGKGI